MNRTVLVVAAHPDDEALGCGGIIARHVAEGDKVYAIFLADGVSSRGKSNKVDIECRNSAALQAQKILGIEQVFMLGFPDNRMDSVPLLEIVQKLEKVIRNTLPETIYTHHCGDLNIDHRITHQAVLTACRPEPGVSFKEIYAFEVLSATEWNTPTAGIFAPNVFVDISNYLHIKMAALEAYQSEMRQEPHSRSLVNAERLAKFRGNSVGVAAAEALSLLRWLK